MHKNALISFLKRNEMISYLQNVTFIMLFCLFVSFNFWLFIHYLAVLTLDHSALLTAKENTDEKAK